MPLPRLALCSYSYGETNGIAHMDQLLAAGLRQAGFTVARFVIMGDIQTERSENDIRFLPPHSAYATLREEFAHTDIVQFNGGFDPYVSFAAASAGVPVLVETMHMPERGGMHPEVDCVICVSTRVAKEQAHPLCRVVPNGIDLERFSLKTGKRDAFEARILQIANPYKPLDLSLDELIPDILSTHPHTSFTAVGGRELRAHERLANFASHGDMPALYHAADLNLLACRNDAFGLTLIEGMACGCLPIGSRDGGAAEFIEHGATGWLAEGGKEDWLRVIRRAIDFLGSPDHVAMQERACAGIAENYSREACIADYVTLFKELSRRFPKRRERRSWLECRSLMEAIFLCRIDLKQAIRSLAEFTRAAKPLPPEFLGHPYGQSAVMLALQMLQLLDDHRESKLLARSFCALMRLSRVPSPLLDSLEGRSAAPHL